MKRTHTGYVLTKSKFGKIVKSTEEIPKADLTSAYLSEAIMEGFNFIAYIYDHEIPPTLPLWHVSSVITKEGTLKNEPFN